MRSVHSLPSRSSSLALSVALALRLPLLLSPSLARSLSLWHSPPRLAPDLFLSDASLAAHIMASSQPPPSANPFTAATTGKRQLASSSQASTKSPFASCSRRSARTQHARATCASKRRKRCTRRSYLAHGARCHLLDVGASLRVTSARRLRNPGDTPSPLCGVPASQFPAAERSATAHNPHERERGEAWPCVARGARDWPRTRVPCP